MKVRERMISYDGYDRGYIDGFDTGYAEAIADYSAMAGYISIDDVMSVFNDYMRGEVDEDDEDIFLEMLKDKAESEDKNAT